MPIQTFQASLPDLRKHVYLTKTIGPVFQVPAGYITMSNRDLVKNIMNLVYRIIPHLLVSSAKNTQVLRISIHLRGSKMLDIYYNDHKWVESEDGGIPKNLPKAVKKVSS